MEIHLLDSPNYLSAAGLIWDIAGAYLLGRAMLADDRAILDLAGTGWGMTLPILRNGIEHRLNTRFGLSLLIIGFSMQAFASAGVNLGIGTSVLVGALFLIPFGWLHAHYKIWVLRDTFRALEKLTSPLFESVVRKAFEDYPDRIWELSKINSGYVFKEPVD